jgi:predicted O-linked N-acetylglucosamine transferase (SPINDLY family)
LRIGYLSSDFREHAMSFLVTPFLQRHDPDQFEVYAYMTHQTEDSVTDSIRRYCRGFRNISGLTDKEAANLIHADGIDVLVDLSGHTTGSRPGILAKRPAPIQATYLGYPDTTGLSVVDYVILDPYIAEGTTQHVESPALLPECLVTFSELPLSPAEVSAPVSRNGFVTFGSLNNLSKLTTSVVACWAEILRRAPTSRLLIAYNGADAPITQENLRYEFGHHGIDKERVMLRAGGARSEFLEHYREVDIFLDTFPYTGTTTTCEALLMNVPVVTLTGTRQCNRVSASILNHLGLSNLVAATIEQYASIAVELGTDSSRLLALRKTLPERLKVSTLQDPKRFTRGLEALYRAMWVRWNGGQRRGAIAVPGRAGN